MDKKKGIPMDYVTKEDLKDHTTDIKEHISLLINPITKEQTETKTILSGHSGINGLVGRMKSIGTNLKMIYGLLLLVFGFLTKLFFAMLVK